MPVNVTTAPISVRPPVSAAISRAMSKSACWMRMVTGMVMGGLAAGHRREEGDLASAGDGRVRPDMGLVDGGADRAGGLEGVGIVLAAAGQPADQLGHGADFRRRLERFLGKAHALAHPGEILDLHPSSSSMRWWTPARK